MKEYKIKIVNSNNSGHVNKFVTFVCRGECEGYWFGTERFATIFSEDELKSRELTKFFKFMRENSGDEFEIILLE